MRKRAPKQLASAARARTFLWLPMDPDTQPNAPLADAGRYPRLSLARERGLVVAAMELPYWIVREGEEFVLKVEAPSHETVKRELARYEHERGDSIERAEAAAPEKVETMSLFIVAWLMSVCWLAQNLLTDAELDPGKADAALIVKGEWWRTLTALTLHGDFAHFAANLATGLLFGAFLVPRFGAGVTWLAVVISGALGNALNAAFYQSQPHISIGASTAVFGALGMLAGAELAARLGHARTRSRWQLIVPLGAGLGLLAFLGVGEEHRQIDFMAHFWGFAAGFALGAALLWLRVKKRTSPEVQRLAGLGAVGLVIAAWWVALR